MDVLLQKSRGLNLLAGLDCISLGSRHFTNFGHSWHALAFWSRLFLSPPLGRRTRHLWFITCPKTLFFFAWCCVVVRPHQSLIRFDTQVGHWTLVCSSLLTAWFMVPQRYYFYFFFHFLLINIWILQNHGNMKAFRSLCYANHHLCRFVLLPLLSLSIYIHAVIPPYGPALCFFLATLSCLGVRRCLSVKHLETELIVPDRI